MTPDERPQGNGGVAADAVPPGLGARPDEIHENVGELLAQARRSVDELIQAADLCGRVKRHPYRMLAAGLGVGYVLGGGLFTPLSRRIIGLVLRLAALPLVNDELLGLAGAAVEGLAGERHGPRSS